MLIVDEPTVAAVHVLHWWQRVQFGWPRFLLAWGTLLQLALAGALAFAPYEQVLTSGTRPVLELASRYTWALLFLVAAALTALTPMMRPWQQALSWIVVMGLGGVWLTAFAVNVLNGSGSAIGLVAWLFLYLPLAAVALHLSLAKR